MAADLEPLFRRVVFNVAADNRDDHLRNPGCVLGEHGWWLAPAFDVNPSVDKAEHGLNIDDAGNRTSLQTVLSTAALYGFSPKRAQQAVTAVVRAVDGWRDGANRAGIARAEIETPAIAFSAHAAYRAHRRQRPAGGHPGAPGILAAMPSLSQQRTQKYIHARQQHAAWLLLASRRAPLMLSCLEALFEHQRDGVPFDDAVQALADMLAAHANLPDFEIDPADIAAQARRELRDWIRRAVITEREGRIHETDALKTALGFVAQLDHRLMTSTASRLAVVQREIDNLANALDPNPERRAAHMERRIEDLQLQLSELRAGRLTLLTDAQAVEGIREVFALATSLRADFRRVEDSWRAADRTLRQSILSAQQHRGAVVDQLLDGHASLLNTQEGRVFESFQQQLANQSELAEMRARIRHILSHPASPQALDDLQHSSLRLLVQQLIKEAKVVQAVRARSEREVSQFMKTGQAAENQRVGQLLNDILQQALDIDWQRQAVRRQPAPLPPLGVALAGLPLIERLRVKSLDGDGPGNALLLTTQYADLDQVEDEFWQAFEGLDRQALLQQTLAVLEQHQQPMTLAALAQALPPGEHDLETLTLWLAVAREAGLDFGAAPEQITLTAPPHSAEPSWRFTVPRVALDAAAVRAAGEEG